MSIDTCRIICAFYAFLMLASPSVSSEVALGQLARIRVNATVEAKDGVNSERLSRQLRQQIEDAFEAEEINIRRSGTQAYFNHHVEVSELPNNDASSVAMFTVLCTSSLERNCKLSEDVTNLISGAAGTAVDSNTLRELREVRASVWQRSACRISSSEILENDLREMTEENALRFVDEWSEANSK